MMDNGAWNRQGVPLYPSSSSSLPGLLKRPRTEYELPGSGLASGQEIQNYGVQNDDRGAVRVIRDTDAIGSAYDRYLQSTQEASYAPGVANNNLATAGLGRGMAVGVSGVPMAESFVRSLPHQVNTDLLQHGQGFGVGGHLPVADHRGHEPISLPPDASKTLFVEGLPPDITRREVAHIFRPFVGYKEVRLVNKGSKFQWLVFQSIVLNDTDSYQCDSRGEPIILCFVDFADPACAATARTALQGYEMDEQSPDTTTVLRIQFSRNPGPRSAAMSRDR